MARERTGSIRTTKDGKIYARVTWVDEVTGKRKEIQRAANNKTHAKEVKKQILRELEEHGSSLLEAAKMTYNELAQHYIDNYLIEPQYVNGRKIAGLRSYDTARLHFKPSQAHFGNRKINSIRWVDIAHYRITRLKTPTKTGGQRSIATVNRELSYIKRAFEIAKREGWLKQNPFHQGDTLISLADETKRERILTREEEARLIEACYGPRAHLRPIIICALDTGMRQGEILKLAWKDINFGTALITVRAFNTKSLKERTIAMTRRLNMELSELYLKAKDELVFGLNKCDHSFVTARKLAGLPDVRFHDLRHTAATRMIQAGIPLPEVGRILGHTQANTTYRYVNANADTARRVAMALDNFYMAYDHEDKKEVIN